MHLGKEKETKRDKKKAIKNIQIIYELNLYLRLSFFLFRLQTQRDSCLLHHKEDTSELDIIKHFAYVFVGVRNDTFYKITFSFVGKTDFEDFIALTTCKC